MTNSFVQRHIPGRSTWVSHPRSSWHQHCQTRRSSSELRTEWQAASWRKTRNHLRPPQDRKESVSTWQTCRSPILCVCAREASPSVYLVRPAYKVHVVFVQKFGHHISSEREGDATVIFTPAQHVLVWVSPQQVTQQTLVRHVCGPHYPADLLHGLKIGREAWRGITHLF